MFDRNRPRRSMLYTPGSKARALEKARSVAADALIFDLEDSVAPGEKPAARDAVAAALEQGGYGRREVLVRINGLDTEWGVEDVKLLAPLGPDAILVPKAQSAQMIEDLETLMDRAGAPERTAIWTMMETPLGMLHAESIATATPRVAGFVIGSNDLVKDMGAQHTPDRAPILTALGLCVLAARAYGLAIVDGVFNAFKDEAGFRDACAQSRAMGFDGRTLIHPAQAPIANAVFAPDADDIDLAKRQIRAFEDAEARGEGVAVVDGRIVENLHVESARRLIERANAIRAMAR